MLSIRVTTTILSIAAFVSAFSTHDALRPDQPALPSASAAIASADVVASGTPQPSTPPKSNTTQTTLGSNGTLGLSGYDFFSFIDRGIEKLDTAWKSQYPFAELRRVEVYPPHNKVVIDQVWRRNTGGNPMLLRIESDLYSRDGWAFPDRPRYMTPLEQQIAATDKALHWDADVATPGMSLFTAISRVGDIYPHLPIQRWYQCFIRQPQDIAPGQEGEAVFEFWVSLRFPYALQVRVGVTSGTVLVQKVSMVSYIGQNSATTTSLTYGDSSTSEQ